MIISRQSQTMGLMIGATVIVVVVLALATTIAWMNGAERTLLFVLAAFCGLLLTQAFILIYALSVALPSGKWELDELSVSHTSVRGRTAEILWPDMQNVHVTRHLVRFSGHRTRIAIPLATLSRHERWKLLRFLRKHYLESYNAEASAYCLEWPRSQRCLRRARAKALWDRLPFFAILLAAVCMKPVLAPVHWRVLVAFVSACAVWRLIRVQFRHSSEPVGSRNDSGAVPDP